MEWEIYGYRDKRPATGQILREGSLTCAYCKGTGLIPDTRGSKCHICRGEGTSHIEGPVVRCPFCNGRGVSKVSSRAACPVCKGKGVVPVVEPVEVCPRCHGKGRELKSKFPCRTCKGRGVVTGKGR